MSDWRKRQVAEKTSAIHLSDRELITAKSIEMWQDANKKFSALCMKGVGDDILEDHRLRAICAYEQMLDAIKTERDALQAHYAVMSTHKKPPRSNA